jgi:predicted ATPase
VGGTDDAKIGLMVFMLTRLCIRHFKQFDQANIDLSSAVVFIGPNNSGKTTALQALALWDAACKQWLVRRSVGTVKEAAKGITIGRKDLVYLSLPSANALWKDLRVREGYRDNGKTKTKNILIEITVEGCNALGDWQCGFEFEYANEAFFYCRPLRQGSSATRMAVPSETLAEVRLAFLPPISGLLMEEPLLSPGRVDVLLGSGRSGEVLRNLCYALYERHDGSWERVVFHLQTLFGVTLHHPVFVSQLGTIELDYERPGSTVCLALTSAGLGMLQTLQLVVYLYLQPGSVLLLDEPDAHLEVLRQRQVYQLLLELARQNQSQLICASHSEVVLNEAVARDTVIAFIGNPHTVSGNKGAQVLKALKDIGFEHYMQAVQTGWVLYLEGSTDLAILQAWAKRLNHPAQEELAKPFVHYLNTNVPSVARLHFNAVREANPDLIGVALFDQLDVPPQSAQEGLVDVQWKRREIENYFAMPDVLLAFAKGDVSDDLIEDAKAQSRRAAMQETLAEVQAAVQTLGDDLWDVNRKASEQVLPPVLNRYFAKTQDRRVPSKGAFYTLIDYQHADSVDAEVVEKLDLIHSVAHRAKTYPNGCVSK